jgi:polar amino acid transport system substrate-binding protein
MYRKLIALAGLGLALVTTACGSSGSSSSATTSTPSTTAQTAASPAVVADLAPTGRLRLAVFAGPPFLAAGTPPSGVAVNLGSALAARLGVPLVTTVYDDPAKLVAAAQNPGWDVAVLPIMPALESKVDYSGPAILVTHTLIVKPGSSIQSLADTDQPGVRIASVDGAGHTQILAGQLHHATLVKVASQADGIAMLKAGTVDAFAGGRFAMGSALAQIPGSRVLSDNFFTARFAMAVTTGRAGGLAYLTEFVEELKASGAVQHALDAAHVTDVPVAPAGSATAAATPTRAAAP